MSSPEQPGPVLTIRQVEPPTDADLDAAWATVSARLAPTPLVDSTLAPNAWLKLETMQPTGSFKVRGALAALSHLPSGHHVIVASAGNHGLAVAWAADGIRVNAIAPGWIATEMTRGLVSDTTRSAHILERTPQKR